MADLKALLGTPNTLKGQLSGSLIPGPKGEKGDKGDKGEKGDKGDKGDPGDDYTLTEQDKQDIAGLVDIPVEDVRLKGVSIVTDGVAELPIASGRSLGLVRIGTGLMVSSSGLVSLFPSDNDLIRSGISNSRSITPFTQHSATFYGLAKASGDTTQSESDNPVGTYTDEAKGSIRHMIGTIPDYIVGEDEILLEETTLNFSKDGDNDWHIAELDPQDWHFNYITDQLTVTFDGVDHIVFPDEYSYFDAKHSPIQSNYFGNGNYLKKKTSTYPFCFYFDISENKWKVVSYVTGDVHVIKIVRNKLTLNIIDEHYYKDISSVRIDRGSGLFSIVTHPTNYAIGTMSWAEGSGTTAEGNFSHAEGYGTTAEGDFSHAEGINTTASGNVSHAEGHGTVASGNISHAEGNSTIASGGYSHAEGIRTVASGIQSHAEGRDTIASGGRAHAEGVSTVASGAVSHTEGYSTVANHGRQHVFGECNIPDPSTEASTARGNYVEIVGNGTDDNNRSNARTLDWYGNESLAGGLTLGMGTQDEVTITPKELKALMNLLSSQQS